MAVKKNHVNAPIANRARKGFTMAVGALRVRYEKTIPEHRRRHMRAVTSAESSCSA